MSTAILCLFLLVIAVFAATGYRRRLVSGCCGAGGAPAVKKQRVKDRNPAHYPHIKTLYIDGMTCGSCVNRVENGLNSLEGVWASADLGTEKAVVRMKELLDDTALKEAVSQAGYRVYKIEHE